jgi:hypothetical protein
MAKPVHQIMRKALVFFVARVVCVYATGSARGRASTMPAIVTTRRDRSRRKMSLYGVRFPAFLPQIARQSGTFNLSTLVLRPLLSVLHKHRYRFSLSQALEAPRMLLSGVTGRA